MASGGARGRQPFLIRARAAAQFWGCSVFELLRQPEAWVELGILYHNEEAAGLEEWAKLRKLWGS